jgi:hypothetical protein
MSADLRQQLEQAEEELQRMINKRFGVQDLSPKGLQE